MSRPTYLILVLMLGVTTGIGCSNSDDGVDAENDQDVGPISNDQPTADQPTGENPTDAIDTGGGGLAGSALSVENHDAAISESLYLLRADYITRILADLTAAGFPPNSDALGLLLNNPGLSQDGEQRVSRDCEGGGTAMAFSTISSYPAGWDADVTLDFAQCVINGDTFAGRVHISFANYAPGANYRDFEFQALSVEKADGSGWVLTGTIDTLSNLQRYTRPVLTTTSNIDYHESTDTAGMTISARNTEHTQRYEVFGFPLIEYDSDGIGTHTGELSYDTYNYTESGSGTVVVGSATGSLELTISPAIRYTSINLGTGFPAHTSIPAEGEVRLTAEDGSSIRVVPGAADSGTVVYEIAHGETSLIESDAFPGAVCWLEPQPSPPITCYQSW